MRVSSRGNPWHDAEGKFCSCNEAKQLKCGDTFIDVDYMSVEEKKQLQKEVEENQENIEYYEKQGETRKFIVEFFGEAKAADELKAYKGFSQEDKEAYQKCIESEKKITETLDSKCNLVGKEFRLKSPSSIAEKQLRKSKSVGDFWDIVRYTHMSDEDSLMGDVNNVLGALEEEGHQIIQFKNTWNDETNPYNGINVKILSPDGQKYELQFHTKASFDLKNGELHHTYEIVRKIDTKQRLSRSDEELKDQLNTRMFALSKRLKRPKGVEEKTKWG